MQRTKSGQLDHFLAQPKLVRALRSNADDIATLIFTRVMWAGGLAFLSSIVWAALYRVGRIDTAQGWTYAFLTGIVVLAVLLPFALWAHKRWPVPFICTEDRYRALDTWERLEYGRDLARPALEDLLFAPTYDMAKEADKIFWKTIEAVEERRRAIDGKPRGPQELELILNETKKIEAGEL